MASDTVCVFCGQGQNAQTVCGKLYSRRFTRVMIAAHKKCMQYSSKLNQNHDDDFGGFDIKDVRKEIRRGKKLFCYWCKQKKKRASGATSGCEWWKCRKTFHFYCAWKHPQSTTCRRRRRDTGEDTYWVFCSQEHKNEYLKSNEGRNETSCSETDDEDDQSSRQHSRAQSWKADKVPGTSEEDESSDPDEVASEDDGVKTASSSNSDQGSKSSNGFMRKTWRREVAVMLDYDDKDGGQESGNEADLPSPYEHDQEESATQATDSEERRHSSESNTSAQSKGERRHFMDSNESAQSNGEEAMPQIKVRKRKAVTSCEEKGEQPGCSTAKRIRSTAGPLQDRTTPDPPRHPVQSSSDPPRPPVQSSSKTTGYQAPTHGNGVPGWSGDGLFQGLSPAASVSCGEAGVQHETEGISGPDSSPDADTCARPGHASALDATAEDPGRLRADQTMTSGDLAATPHHETGLTSFPNLQGQCGTRTLDAEVESELYLQREYLRSEIRRNNIVIDKVEKNMAWLEEKQRRKTEKREREEKQHAALMAKLQTEMALMEQRKNREEELHVVAMQKMHKELEVCNMTLKKIQEERTLIEDMKKRAVEKREREEESDKREEKMYKRFTEESTERQECYNRHFKQ